MGLSDADIADITKGWLLSMTAAQEAIVAAGAYTWSLIPGQDNGPCGAGGVWGGRKV